MKHRMKYFVGFLLTAFVFSGIGAYAGSYLASDISYRPKDSNWKVSNVADAINSLQTSKTSDNYSTEEKVVGTWIDGKPLYQLTWDGGTIPAEAVNGYNLTFPLSNVEHIHVVNAWTQKSDGTVSGNVPYPNPVNSGSPTIGILINSTTFRLYTISDRSAFGNVWVTVQYTKTTDTVNS